MMKRYICCFAAICLSACTAVSPEVDNRSSVSRTSPAENGLVQELDRMIGGRPVLLNFWASTCAFCKQELPLLQATANEQDAVAVITVNMREPEAVARAYWQGGGYTLPYLLDTDGVLQQRYGVTVQPTTIGLDPDGSSVFRKEGPLSDSELQEAMNRLRSFREIPASSSSPQKTTVIPSAEDVISGKMYAATFGITESPVPDTLLGWYRDTVRHLIPLEGIVTGGPPRDGIPALDQPTFTNVVDAQSWLTADDQGILVRIENDVRFYPHRILNWHEAVNDTVGGRSLAVTFCPLCASGVVYGRTISAGETTFGISGLLAESNLLLYDRETKSLWNQITGQAVIGPLTGESLEFIRSDVVTFAEVAYRFPQALVLNPDTGYDRDYSGNPYAGYEEDAETMFPVTSSDDRLPSKSLVYGIVVGGQPKAYPPATLAGRTKIWDRIAGVPVLIEFNHRTEMLSFRNPETGELFPEVPLYWFAWVAQHPDTELYGQ